jgi:hypothetical protein
MNPQEITAITAATQEITGVIKGLFNWRAEKNAQKQLATKAALTSLVLAATEPRQYLADVRMDPAAKSFEREHKLAALWANAGMDMGPINGEVANAYLLKADYWSDRDGWSQAAKDERAIQLDEVYRLGREALLGI